MDFSNDFTVPQPIDEVWAKMLHLDQVLALVPYTTVLDGSDSHVNARFDIRFGSVSMSYTGDAEIIERDDANHRAVMRASARQTQGRSRVEARVEIQLTSAGASTNGRLLSTVDVPVLGGQTGQATVRTTTETMIIDFAEKLAAMRAPATPLAA